MAELSTFIAPTVPQAFRQRLPWWGGDLQTLRDTLRPLRLPYEPPESTFTIEIGQGDRLLVVCDRPASGDAIAVVVLLHGLGGSSEGQGTWRLAMALRQAGFLVLRLNLRGAGRGRSLARGTYAAQCNRDLQPVLVRARQLGLPVYGAGISLGGTILLNACLDPALAADPGAVLDGLVCISSPLDLQSCCRQFERGRNLIYQRWLVRHLIRQTLADPFGPTGHEQAELMGRRRPRTIRAFDALITAPRWGYGSVDHYYSAASPLPPLLRRLEMVGSGAPCSPLPPMLLMHAGDDPWVPVAPIKELANAVAGSGFPAPEVLLTSRGGHNGFHGQGDSPMGCWSDRIAAGWLLSSHADRLMGGA